MVNVFAQRVEKTGQDGKCAVNDSAFFIATLSRSIKGLPRRVMRTALSALKAPGEGAITAAPAKRVADARQAVMHHRVVDAASRKVSLVLTAEAGKLWCETHPRE